MAWGAVLLARVLALVLVIAMAPGRGRLILLMKAGWQEGSGLGLHGQGASSFLAPASQQHSRGLGFQKGEAGAAGGNRKKQRR